MKTEVTLNNVQYQISAKYLTDVQGFPFDSKDTMHHNEYNITIANMETKKKISFKFYGSQADWQAGKYEMDNQDLAFALYSFLQDALSGIQNSFDSFCSEFGYDTDSRQAEKIYNACLKSGEKAEKIGFDEKSLCDSLNTLSEKYNC